MVRSFSQIQIFEFYPDPCERKAYAQDHLDVHNYQKKKKSCTFILFCDICSRQSKARVLQKAFNNINIKSRETGEMFHLRSHER